jgi:hypothetical protein
MSKKFEPSQLLKLIPATQPIVHFQLLTSNTSKVNNKPSRAYLKRAFLNNKQRKLLMGAILEGAELLKNPVGIIGLVAIIAGGWYFYKWVTKEDEHHD